MSSHTPGPWHTTEYDPGDDIEIMSEGGVFVATVSTCWPCAEDEGCEQQEEGDANARLIPAAPDLFDACKIYMLAVQGKCFFSDVVSRMEKAIAKAEGVPQ